jgi:hypothetical protein
MILYNVTVGIDPTIEQEWLGWMKTIHIPEVMATGMFVSYKIYKVFIQQEGDNPSYSIQYFAENIDKVNSYLDKYAPALQQVHMQRYMNKHVAFRTLLEEV